MDTPERNRFEGPPISKFEDSPVFNFINSLSPIQPVKSVHSINTFQSPGSATISSVFSSPHVSLHKESRFFIRNPFPDSVKQDTSSDLLNESNIPAPVSNVAVLFTSDVLAQESSNICLLNRATVDPADENSTQPNFSESVQFNNGSPEHNITPLYGIKLDFKLDISCTPSKEVQFVQNISEVTQNSLCTEIGLDVKFSADKIKEDASGSDWENLISDNVDGLQIFEPTAGLGTSKIQEQDNGFSLSAQPKGSLDTYLYHDSRDTVVDDDEGTSEFHTLNLLPTPCQEQEFLDEENQKTEAELDDGSSLGYKIDSQQHREGRRRCLDFENTTVSKKNLNSPINAKPISGKEQLISSKNLKTPKQYILPGIGLHLNAIARTSKDRPVSHKTKAHVGEFISRPCSVRPCALPAIAGEKPPPKAFDLQQGQDPLGSEVQENQIVIFDDSLTPALGIDESASPKKKRRKVENCGENESCRRCNCKKSKCLKLYCECFAAGVYCVEPCSCQGCLNKPIHEETVLATRKQIESRNPLAFAPKVIRASEHVKEMGEESNKTPASARHKRGCNCKKSNCLKKYCECYQGGVGCSLSCRCEGCKNAFGRKDGSEEMECEDEIDACEKESVNPDDDKANAKDSKAEHIQLSESPLPITPFGACRPFIKPSILSSGKPPRTSALILMKTSENQQEQAQCKFNENEQNFPDAETPENLRIDSSPCSAVKTASPNGKRVSLPLNGFGMSPNLKGGRKLILKSIPSFPSLVSSDSPSCSQFNSSVLN